MENKEYKNMTLSELWQEILNLVNATHFISEDKSLFLQLIKEYSFKCQEGYKC